MAFCFVKGFYMDKNKKDAQPAPQPRNAVERFYERFRKVPLKYLDIFIGVCVAAFVVVVTVGVLKGHGIL